MATVEVHRLDGSRARSVELDEAVFGIEPNGPVTHQVVTAQRAAARAGTHSTRTRSEVAGGGGKPWRQKGTGRSRQGSIRAPQWTGGGVAFGPRPRGYRKRTPKKMVQLALRSALSDRASEGRVAIVEEWTFSTPRTKDAKAALAALGVEGRALVVVPRDDEVALKSFRNLPDVHVIPPGELNAYDVLTHDWVVFSLQTLPSSSPASREESAVPSWGEEPAVTSAEEGQVPEEPTSAPALKPPPGDSS